MKLTQHLVVALTAAAITSCIPSKKDPYDTGDLYGSPDAALTDDYTGDSDSLYDTPAAYDHADATPDAAPDLTPAEPPASGGSYFRTHTVQKGDSLSRISNKYNVSMSAIIEANNIKNKNLLVIGQKLIIPSR